VCKHAPSFSSENEVRKTRRSRFDDNVRLISPLPDGVSQGILNIRVKKRGRRGGGAAKVSHVFLFFGEKECWKKLTTRGGGVGQRAQLLLQVFFISVAL